MDCFNAYRGGTLQVANIIIQENSLFGYKIIFLEYLKINLAVRLSLAHKM